MNNSMSEDIRDKAVIGHADVIALNFIKSPGRYHFRRHFRQGLRSHVMEIISHADLEKEKTGTVVDGLRWYPKATPYKIFRIFRTRLKTLDSALREIGTVKLVERYLAPDHMACSREFVVDYQGPGGRDLLLCGIQDYVEGEILDPWSILDTDHLLASMYALLCGNAPRADAAAGPWIARAQHKSARLIAKIKRMIRESGHVPDLAGAGNLVMAGTGEIKLVDINNISEVFFDTTIRLDDRGYPVCDKSIEALSLLESKTLGRPIDRREKIYKIFLDLKRRSEVKKLEEVFHRRMINISDTT
jgi:hypothetical protein